MIECVVNVSEGRDAATLDRIAASAGALLLDLHSDPHHNRAVLTLAGGDAADVEDAARSVVSAAVAAIDLRTHTGAHPRLGAADVVPFAPIPPDDALGDAPGEALAARDRTARWIGETLGVPCFLYGPERSLPDVRRLAFRGLDPDTGPPEPHRSAGATAVGARPVLVAYNLWLDGAATLADARAIAVAVRGLRLRTLGLDLDGHAQVSCNLVAPRDIGPDAVYRAVAQAAALRGRAVERAELVGLVPEEVLRAVPPRLWKRLGLGEVSTIEARLAAAARR